MTEKEFETKCKDWFRHAKHRFENEKRRQNMTKVSIIFLYMFESTTATLNIFQFQVNNDNILSQEAPVVRDDERDALSGQHSKVDASSN